MKETQGSEGNQPDENAKVETAPQPHVHGPNCNHGHHQHHVQPFERSAAKVGRNDVCPCGSGKKYKKCCG